MTEYLRHPAFHPTAKLSQVLTCGSIYPPRAIAGDFPANQLRFEQYAVLLRNWTLLAKRAREDAGQWVERSREKRLWLRRGDSVVVSALALTENPPRFIRRSVNNSLLSLPCPRKSALVPLVLLLENKRVIKTDLGSDPL